MTTITLFDPARLGQPDADGHLFHPDLPDYGDDEPWAPRMLALGYECHEVCMSDQEAERYVEQNSADLTWWHPQPPAGAGWLLVWKGDSEDGAVAAYTRPLEGTCTEWERDEESTLASLLLVGDHSVTAADIALWTDAQCRDAEAWAAARHFRASDNDDIVVPPVPRCVQLCGELEG